MRRGDGTAEQRSAPRFEIGRRLGAGGFGVVHEAYDHGRGATVALKTLKRLTPASLVRLKEEFRGLADVAHPGLVTLHDLHVEGDDCFFTMELVEGHDVVSWIRRTEGIGGARSASSSPCATETGSIITGVRARSVSRRTRPAGGFDETRLRSALAQLADAIGALHAAGKMHRDLKPSNVLVRADGHLVILDYGLVEELDGSGVASAAHPGFEGTAAYAAPEQATAGALGPAADLYAVGVILHEALTGELPFEGTPLQILADKQQRDAEPIDASDVPADLLALCSALLARDPGKRPTTDAILGRLAAARPAVRSSEHTLVGRESELARLRAAWARRREGTSIVVLEGPSGIGKSALGRAFLERLGPNALILSGRCSVRESVAYNAFDGVVDGIARVLRGMDEDARRRLLQDDRSALPRIFPVLADLVRGDDDGGDAPDADASRLRAFRALRALLGRFADTRDVVLFVDDWQWADRDSEALLAELPKGTSGEPPRVLIVLTRRIGAEPMPLPWDAERIAVGPLSDEAAEQLVRTLVSDATRVAAIRRAAAGHPMFLHEMGLRGEAAETPNDLDAAIRSRVAALDEQARTIVEVVSLAASPLEERALAHAARTPSADALKLIERLRVGRLVRTELGRSELGRGAALEPFHDRVREAVVEGLTGERRTALHARIAEALRSTGVDHPEALVHHLAGSGDRAGAARAAEQAALHAETALAFDGAASLLRERLRLGTETDASEQVRALRLRLAAALANAHRAPEAGEVLLLVADGADPRTRARALRRAAELFLTAGDLERGRALLAAVLEEFDRPLPKTSAHAVLALAAARLRISRRGLDMNSQVATDPTLVDRADLLRGVAQGLGMVDNLRAAAYQARALGAALDLGDPARAAIALAIESIFRGSVSSAGRRVAQTILARADVYARATSDPEPACWIEAARAVMTAFELAGASSVDRLARAEERFARQTTGQTWAVDSLRLVRVLSLRVLGDFDALRAVFPEYLGDARRRGDMYFETTLRRGGVILWLGDGRVDAARAALSETRWPHFRDGFHIQHWAELEAESELDLYVGDGATVLERRAPMVRALRFSLVQRLQRVRILARGLLGRLLLAQARSGRSRVSSLLECAFIANRLDGEGVGYGAARAALLRAGIAAVRGDHEAAMRALRTAIELGDRHGLQLVSAAARARLAPLISGDEGRALGDAATSWFRAQRIRDPERLLAVETPGFDG